MEKSFVYMAACSPEKTGGIYGFEMTDADDFPVQKGFTPLTEASYLCFSPDRKFLYASFKNADDGAVAAYRINPDHSLTFLNSLQAGGLSTCHLLVAPGAHFLYCVNYRNGTFAEMSLNQDGSLNQRTQRIQHRGKGVNPARQEGPHTHCTVLTPDQRYLVIVDLGIDSLKTYAIDPVKGLNPDSVITCKLEDGVGPRHLIFDDAGTLAYLVNELGNSVTTLHYSDGYFTPIATYTSLPANCDAVTKASAIRFSPDRRFLFVSNRGFDSIACYRVLPEGKLELYDIVDAHGSSPRDFDFLPGGKLLAVTNEFTNNVCYFRYDSTNGKLSFTGTEITLPRPLCVVY